MVVARTGFSTHTVNMGMHCIELVFSYTRNAGGSATLVLRVAQLPLNAAALASGQVPLFVLVGMPSVGQLIMVGSSKVEKQPTRSVAMAAVKTDVCWVVGTVAATMMVHAASIDINWTMNYCSTWCLHTLIAYASADCSSTPLYIYIQLLATCTTWRYLIPLLSSVLTL